MSFRVTTYDFAVRAGNSGTVQNEAGIALVIKSGSPPEPFDLGNDEVIFIAALSAGGAPVIRKTSAEAGEVQVIPAEGKIVVPITVSDTLAMADAVEDDGQRLIYSVERRRGSARRTELSGEISVLKVARDA